MDSSRYEDQDGWNTLVMLAVHALISPLSSWEGLLYDVGLFRVDNNVFVMSLKHQCGIQSSHQNGGVSCKRESSGNLLTPKIKDVQLVII